MQPIPAAARRWLLSAAVLIVAGCGESEPADIDTGNPTDNGGSTGSDAGTAVLVVRQVGQWLDPDGFVVVVDGSRRIQFGAFLPNYRVSLEPGRHQLALEGVSANCVTDRPVREVEMGPNATVRLDFAVTCRGTTLRLRVRAAAGVDTDPDGYGIRLHSERRGHVATFRVSATDTALQADVPPEPLVMAVNGLWPNCVAGVASPDLTPPLDAVLEVELAPMCRALPSGGVVFSADGTVMRLIEGSNEPIVLGAGWSPAWSPDGARIAFVAHAPGVPRGLRTMAANGRDEVQVAPLVSADPRFLADGRLTTGPSEVWLPGGGASPSPWAESIRPILQGWTADLSINLVRRDDGDSTSSLRTVVPEGTGERVVFAPRGDVTYARLLPDGQRVLVTVDNMYTYADYGYTQVLLKPCDPADCGVWLVELASGSRVPFSAANTWEVLAFSADGTRALINSWDPAKGRRCLRSVATSGPADERELYCLAAGASFGGADWR